MTHYAHSRLLLPLLALWLLAGCSTTRITEPVALARISSEAAVPEAQLLDIGIELLAPLSDPATNSELTLRNLRLAESHYLSWQLAQTLQQSGHWGSIRLNPFMLRYTDLRLTGTLLQSDGETLRMKVEAFDSTGRRWLDKEYVQLSDARSYAAAPGDVPSFPFHALLNQVANDVLAFRESRLGAADIAEIRNTAALAFAADFVPEAYAEYMRSDRDGRYVPDRLPAANDPVYAEITAIRERNALFLDAIQAQYEVFVRQVDEPYRRFLARSERITNVLNRGVREEIDEEGVGAASLDGPTNARNRYLSSRIAPGTRSDRLNAGANAKLYAAALAEGGASFEMDLQPQTLEFSTHTVTLSGTIEQQYQQWRDILAEMHALDGAR